MLHMAAFFLKYFPWFNQGNWDQQENLVDLKTGL